MGDKTPKSGSISFHVYRYQLLPKSLDLQMHLFDNRVNSIEELRKEKNNIFWTILSELKTIEYQRNEEINFKKDYSAENVVIYSINCKRTIKIPKKDFTENEVPVWPPITIIINNEPLVQKIGISINPRAFQSTLTVAKILEDNFNIPLSQYNLSIYIKPTYDKKDFWTIVDSHSESIYQIRFELISPNMSNIANDLMFDLHELNRSTNTHQTDLEINSQPETTLKIEKTNTIIQNLAKYSSQGGGDILFRIRNYRHRIRTSKNVSEVSFSEADIRGNPEVLINFFNKLSGDLEKPND